MTKDKKVVIGINGFGRIGSVVLRAILMEKYEVEVGAINTTGQFDIETFAMQFKYDSVYGRFPAKVGFSEPEKAGEIGRLNIGDRSIPFLGEMDPSKIKWKNYDVDVVLECTGAFTNNKALAHTKGGQKRW
jgi:glyceraldehyde 3-phosphate dehydrogenase